MSVDGLVEEFGGIRLCVWKIAAVESAYGSGTSFKDCETPKAGDKYCCDCSGYEPFCDYYSPVERRKKYREFWEAQKARLVQIVEDDADGIIDGCL